MLWLSLDQIQPGMALGSPVAFHTEEGCDIVDAGTPIDAGLVVRLHESGLDRVWVDDPCGTGVHVSLNPFVTAALDSLAVRVRRFFSRAARFGVDSRSVRELAEALGNLERRMFRESGPLWTTGRLLQARHPEIDHAVNVCYLAVGLALRAADRIREARRPTGKSKSDDLSSLALAAVLHDIGKLQAARPDNMPHVFIARDDDRAYRSHVTIGRDMLRDYRDRLVALIILNHHQRFDGTGFPVRTRGNLRANGEPAGMSGDGIHIFARLVGLADAIDRLRLMRPGPHATAYALSQLHGPYRAWFDPDLVQQLGSILPPYFPGELMSLKDGSTAAIDRIDPAKPLSAELEVVFDRDGRFVPAGERRKLAISAATILGVPEISAQSVPATA